MYQRCRATIKPSQVTGLKLGQRDNTWEETRGSVLPHYAHHGENQLSSNQHGTTHSYAGWP